MKRLQNLWRTQQIELVATTDGGLKDSVGTSSYALFFPNEFPPIIQGFAGEYQPQKSASSTRQELLGQLGMEYWFDIKQLDYNLLKSLQARTRLFDGLIKGSGLKDIKMTQQALAC